MKLNARTLFTAATLIALLAAHASGVQAQSSTVAPNDAIPITQLITEVAKRTGKTFLLDPRVQSEVVLDAAIRRSLDYAGLLSVLQLHGFATVEGKDFVQVIPAANVRQLPLPLISSNAIHPSAEYVSRMVAVKTIPATHLVPILRPLLPLQAHLVAFPCTNVLLIVDSFANVKRIEKLVQALDTGSEAYKPDKCGVVAAKAP